jgi:hypothetical protein
MDTSTTRDSLGKIELIRAKNVTGATDIFVPQDCMVILLHARSLSKCRVKRAAHADATSRANPKIQPVCAQAEAKVIIPLPSIDFAITEYPETKLPPGP